ncbi:MAG TPA: hypothetical protein VK644_03145 [Chitinophagaceae bacterium]|nr:hypothetical protein [Chitinophagaceae bacterium]
MKKTAIIASAALLLLTASVNAQTDTTAKPMTAHKDTYNNWDSTTYKMQPMPEALTTAKVFPVIGQYQLTDKSGTASTVSVMLDETNKGVIWIDGLPEGKIKANLRKSPAVYKIPAQKLGEEKDAKSVAEGVLIYDKDANVLNLCVGCTYNAEDPAVAFAAPAEPETTPEMEKKPAKKTTTKTKKEVAKIKPVIYTGSKILETSASVNTTPQQ